MVTIAETVTTEVAKVVDEPWLLSHAWIIPALMALSFVLILFFGRRLPKRGAEIGIPAVVAAFVMSCVAVVQWIQHVDELVEGEGGGGEALRRLGRSFVASGGEGAISIRPITDSFTWWSNGLVKFDIGIQIDGLAVMMLFVVTLISMLVHIYSTAYMEHDERYTHFYAALSLFTASMLVLVIAENSLMLLSGWELVGLCSFMLIGHWWEEKPNTNAALKAFLTTRTGDIGLLLGVIVTFFAAGRTFNIIEINEAALAGKGGHTVWLIGASLLLMGIIGKSGQFPLHTWLPDAMAGPTPVSALIHAATMVVAGVYLGARMYGVFWQGFSIADGGMNAMAIIGAITIIVGACLAFVQNDIKKVLAYSTISQLGYMVLGLGVGAWVGAIFHLFTHAFFKALLFLGAGSISHSGSHHSFDMKKDMGGLRKFMPVTFVTFMIGSLALAGIAPLAGFWSKDEILATAGQTGFQFFQFVGILGAVLTAAYMTRCVYLTFFGEYRGHGHPHESPKAITIPLIVLAGFSILAGFANAAVLGIEKFVEYVEPRYAFPPVIVPEFETTLAAVSVMVVLASIGVASALWFRKEELGPLRGLTERNAAARAGYTFLVNKYYLDDLYTDGVVAGVKGPLARATYWFNQNVIDAVPNGLGRIVPALGRRLYDHVDQGTVDAAYNGLARETGQAGGLLRRLQSGQVQRYALLIVFAVAIFSIALMLAR
jgi:NADH-quinone oxidoreductase subunit L